MWSIRTAVLTGLAVLTIGAVWHAKIRAQEKNSGAGVVTVYDHKKLEESFAKAAAAGGTELFWSHTSSIGTYSVNVHSREPVKGACKPEGCGHTGYTAFVYVTNGAATLVIGGSAKAMAADRFGGQLIQGGESHRISKGDVFIMPPDTVHWYKDMQAPFEYIEVPVP
jgi:hypothetical protein